MDIAYCCRSSVQESGQPKKIRQNIISLSYVASFDMFEVVWNAPYFKSAFHGLTGHDTTREYCQTRFSKYHGSIRVGSEGASKYHGSIRVGTGDFRI